MNVYNIQNMIEKDVKPEGLIVVAKDELNNYFFHSQDMV